MQTTQNKNSEAATRTQNLIDVVIPIAAKDLPKLPICIRQLSNNSLTPINKIYIVTQQFICQQKRHLEQSVVWIPEESYSFSLVDIKTWLINKGNKYSNSSWYYQQLLKFYIFDTIPDLLPNTLILDVDFFISQPLAFLTNQGQAILSYGYPFKWLLNTRDYPKENHHSHIEFARRFVPQWFPVNPFSGMHHHILFKKEIITKLFSVVENHHHQYFWQTFLDNIEFYKWNAASEYVIYYHFARQFFPKTVISRHLKSCDFIHDHQENSFTLDVAKNILEQGIFDTVGCHGFLNLRARLKTMDYIPDDLRERMLTSEQIVFKLILDDGVLTIEGL